MIKKFIFNEKNYYLFWLIIVTLSCIFFYIMAVGIQYKREKLQIVHGADPMYYFSYVRSIAIDFDLNLKNEYEYFNIKEKINPKTGYPINKYPVGFPLLILPFFYLTHLIILFFNFLGFKIVSDGFSLPYQLSFCYASILYGYLGLIITYHLCKKYFSPFICFLSLSIILLATNILYYFFKGPYYSHLTSFFVSSLFILFWLETFKERNLYKYFLMGVFGSLLAIIRLQDIIFLLLPFISFLYFKIKKIKELIPSLKHIFAFLVGTMPFFLIQMLAYKIIFGSFLAYSYGEEKFIYAFSPKIFPVLFSSRHGLISWHPLILFCLLGLLISNRHRIITLLLFLVFLMQLYIISSWHCWYFGYSFGHRAFISSLPIFAFGLSSFIHSLNKKLSLKYIFLLSLPFIFWNFIMMLAYLTEIIPPDNYFHFKDLILNLKNIPKLIIKKL